jgi:hypothetical protein
MMVGRGWQRSQGPGTNVQMKMFSWTHLVEKLLDRTIPLAFIMEKMQMTIYSLTDPSHM